MLFRSQRRIGGHDGRPGPGRPGPGRPGPGGPGPGGPGPGRPRTVGQQTCMGPGDERRGHLARPPTRTTASLAARAVANPGLMTVLMIRSRWSKWANALFIALIVSHSMSDQP